MVCHATTCRMARNPSRVAVKRREVGGLQGEAFSALDLSEIGCVESHPTRISGRSSVDPAPRRCHCRHFQGQNRHCQGRRRRNFHTRQIRKSLGGFSKISRHANRNKITVSVVEGDFALFSPKILAAGSVDVLLRRRLLLLSLGLLQGEGRRGLVLKRRRFVNIFFTR